MIGMEGTGFFAVLFFALIMLTINFMYIVLEYLKGIFGRKRPISFGKEILLTIAITALYVSVFVMNTVSVSDDLLRDAWLGLTEFDNIVVVYMVIGMTIAVWGIIHSIKLCIKWLALVFIQRKELEDSKEEEMREKSQ